MNPMLSVGDLNREMIKTDVHINVSILKRGFYEVDQKPYRPMKN